LCNGGAAICHEEESHRAAIIRHCPMNGDAVYLRMPRLRGGRKLEFLSVRHFKFQQFLGEAVIPV
jgi:hypothetical protein